MAESALTLDRGLRLLELLADSPNGRSVAELAAALGVSRPVVYRLVTALEAHGLARRGPGGRVSVGLAVLDLAGRVRPLLRETAAGPLRELAEKAGATAHLTVADGGEALALMVVEPSWTDVHVAYRVGLRHPLTRGAAGRAILAGREPDSDKPFVVTTNELQEGASGVAAPVLGVPGLEASVGLVTLTEADPSRMEVLGQECVLTASALTKALT